jgi:hypothetical protein
MALPTPGSRRSLVEPVLGDAFDSLFFSPLWGHAGTARLPGQVFNPARSFLLQVLHQYGLTGLGLLAWFFADALRRSAQLGFGRHGGAELTWRLVPVAWVLFAAMALLSGEPARFHSWWGCVLLGGFVQGVHERTFPGRAPRGPPRWLEGPLRGSGRAARLLLRTARGIGRAGAWLLRAGLAVGFGLVRGVGALLRGGNPGRGTFRRTASPTAFRGFRR